MKPVPQIMDDGREITVLKVGDDHCFIGSRVSRNGTDMSEASRIPDCVQTEDGYDFVTCSNCDFQGEVPAGEDVCPSCASDGALMWTCEVPKREGNPNDAD